MVCSPFQKQLSNYTQLRSPLTGPTLLATPNYQDRIVISSDPSSVHS